MVFECNKNSTSLQCPNRVLLWRAALLWRAGRMPRTLHQSKVQGLQWYSKCICRKPSPSKTASYGALVTYLSMLLFPTQILLLVFPWYTSLLTPYSSSSIVAQPNSPLLISSPYAHAYLPFTPCLLMVHIPSYPLPLVFTPYPMSSHDANPYWPPCQSVYGGSNGAQKQVCL